MNQQQKNRANNNKNAKKTVGNAKKKKSVTEAPAIKKEMNKKSENNINNNNKNVSKKEKSKIKVDKEKKMLPDPPVKLERSKTFVFGNKINKVLNKLTGSRDSLNKIDNNNIDEQPSDNRFNLKRSLTLSSISIKRNNRKSLREPVLEELKEDAVLEKINNNIPENNSKTLPVIAHRSSATFEPPPFKRSGSFIDRLKSKLSTGKTQSNLVRNSWSASLQSLQQIDTMVKYDDLKFVDYDKFNTYEQRLEKDLNSLNTSQSDLWSLGNPSASGSMGKRYPSASSLKSIESINATVRMRAKKRISFNMSNLDEDKNVFRHSLETASINALSKDKQRTVLNKRGSIGGFEDENDYVQFLKESFINEQNEQNNDIDVVDSAQKDVKNPQNEAKSAILRPKSLPCISETVEERSNKLKSRSLTHLDQLEPQIRTEDDTISSSSNKRGKQKISSSEYFSVCFDTENGFGEKDEIFIPATKGVYLSDSLLPALSHRSLSFSQISIIDNGMHNQYELGIPTYLGPLTGNTDIGSLAGRNLIVTEKDNSKRTGHSSLQKAASVGFRTKQSRFFSSASTEEAIIDNDGSKVTKQQTRQAKWSLQLFGVKNPQQSQLCELLNNYTKNGVPQSKTSSCSNFNNPEYLEALDGLENLPSSWTDIVTSTGMTETETKIQSAIWELVTTEIDYIHALKTVTDLFLACLEAIQMENILTEVDQNKLFSNIRDICEANLKFWSMYLYPMVKNCILTGYAMCIDYFQQGFSTFSSIFAPYAKYCAEQSTCQYYCKELNQNNALFTAYLAWCESQKMCNRLRLADILVRPMQRLTKYSLLLTAIRKHIADENDGEIMDSMIHSVEDFVCSVNAHLTTRQENERLKGIMARIEAYDVVDTNNEHLEKMVKQFSSMIDLCGPMRDCPVAHGRHLFMEGDLKFKDHLSKIDVHCFLLTDMLLICKTTAKKGHGTLKVVRQPYQTDRLQIKLKDNTIYCCYLNDYSLVIAAFTLQCSEAKNWHDSITKAKHIYTRLKQGSPWDPNYTGSTANTLQVRKSPLNSSIGSRVSSLNNSHSGSIELTESRNVSVDFEKTNSVSSDEGSSFGIAKNKIITTTSNCGSATTATSRKLKQTSSNSLTIQPYTSLGQSMPNLNVHSTHTRNNNENEYDKTNRNTITLGFGATTSTSSHEKCAELIKLEFCLPTYYKINLHR
uniref:CSON009190 protein n=1 Tax=Culicoides sonorensis TaxID=179676 RepID=A0A336LZI8_CULSO